MAEEYGTIIKLKGSIAVIKAQRTSACESCSSKKSCSTGNVDNEIFVEAENAVGAKVGDKVIFNVGAASVLKAGLLLYLLPIICFITGVVLGQVVFAPLLPGKNPDLISGLFGAGFLAAAFFGLKLYGRLADKSKSMRPRILKVV